MVCVFANFALLYFDRHTNLAWLSPYSSSPGSTGLLWMCIIIVLVITIVKFSFRALINDKPNWVFNLLEKQKVSNQAQVADKND